ncbi:helix-turn-helix transcriptional regulator [Synoicihabitans lomoniglobus]|uniref:Helix-turn-helix domain-containing protein n=1 Tax=Synoicihabitans lomoniglobus TaxID=2909285 RepID=A0AAF0CRA0_9BACT|nr:AraC family transcriptional regulator [Opitutaceae bacterium LMO-M01]WED66603.1 helix-turn-helix domain-containing protein [Opitutaceae bacterium LMO-M01]
MKDRQVLAGSCPGKPLDLHDRAAMREIFSRSILAAERQRLRLRVPRLDGLLQKHKDMHFHFRPEIFIQLQGTTEFRFPKESITLLPGEMLIVPAGLPHGETIFRDDFGKFRNLVVGFYSHTLSLHFAHEVAPQRPDIETIEFFEAADLETFVLLTNQVVGAYHMQSPARDALLKGLSIAVLGMFQNLVETGGGSLEGDIGKVLQVKWIVREQFSNSRLNVKSIAERLQCSPDYLSYLFHNETGEKLIHYIQRVRIDGAVMALESSPLYISEIAYASGFSDPAYFARVFKKHRGESPADFRERLDQQRQRQEERPKTIYYDHVDFTAGSPVVATS